MSKDDNIVTLVSAMRPFHGKIIVNKMEKLGKEVTCDAIVKKMCKVHRATGSGKSIVEDPGETELADPGYFGTRSVTTLRRKGSKQAYQKQIFPYH